MREAVIRSDSSEPKSTTEKL